MKIYKKVLTKKLTDVKCDACGKSCTIIDGIMEYGIIEAFWGYGSKKDGNKYEKELCESCFDKVTKFVEELNS